MYINSRISKRTQLLSGIAAVLMLAALVIDCKTNVNSAPETFTVTFSVDGGNGTLKAKADGIAETDKNPITVEKDKTVTFTAKAAAGYAVDTWTVTPSEALQTGGKAGEATATVKVNADTTVKVTFKPVASPPPPAPFGKTYKVGDVAFTMKEIAAVTNGSVGHSDESDNKPHKISLSAYLIGETEVTQELWEAVMGAGSNPSYFKGTSKPPASGEEQGKRPVEWVSWYDCIAFCNELTKKVSELGVGECVYYSNEGCTTVYTKADGDNQRLVYQKMEKKGFRLPTEAEWEWAAKGRTEDKWSGTNVESELVSYAWYGDKDHGKTHEVKKKSPNGYGLYDMSGNVWEWCWDRYSSTTPAGGQTDPQGAASGSDRVFRGGSWDDVARLCVVGRRFSIKPDFCDGNLGFRVACRP